MAYKCPKCQGELRVEQQSVGNARGVAVGASGLVIGVLLTLTVCGAIIGIPLIIASMFQGGKKVNLLVCRRCGYVASA